ncbi:cyclin domain protein [Necator americanus]|uniref:Cyclin domain protein n=1 Tax=Necator americanus TaxID=51031 RepID=W2T7Z9_NECAM|nr:cyclin domain protein [Necator americanus]ETN77271.1 cyclin domain protein [Necator americanus]
MGNSSCCLRSSDAVPRDEKNYAYEGQYTRSNQVEFQYVNQSFPRDETSTNFLPHISEREVPEVGEEDPSTHPTARPTFMERSKSEMKLKDNRRSCYMLDAVAGGGGFPGVLPKSLRKSSSCSTIYMDDSTISQPNLKNTIKCISLAIYYHIANRKNRSHERLMEIFEERLHPITREALPPELMTKDPDHRQIYRFVRTLFHSAQLTAECAIITLVYIERLLNYAEMDLCPSNWRRVVLGAIMLASKPLYKERAKRLEVSFFPDKRVISQLGFILAYFRVEIRFIDNLIVQAVTVLNESVDGSGKLVFKNMEKRMDKTEFVESDCDEELLFNIPFCGQVRITGIAVIGDEDSSHPAKIRLFKDRPAMCFDDCGIEADQEIDLKQDPNGVVDYPLKASKFGTLSHLSIHVQKNFGAELTKVFYIGLRGEYEADFKQRVAIATYESRPMLKDHKGEIPDSVRHSLF